jgi:hypothetical protein
LNWRFHALNSPATIPFLQKAHALALRPDSSASRTEKQAERETAQHDVLLREVDDALRQDEMMGAMKRYGRPVLGLVGAGLIALAGYLWWEHSTKAAAGERSEQLTLAMDQLAGGNTAGANAKLAPLANGDDPGTRSAALLLQAGVAVEQGKGADAEKLLARVAADADAPQAFRDLATVRDMALKFDRVPPQQVIDRLKPLAVPGNPWFGNAGELVAMAHVKAGQPKQAGPLLVAIAKDKNLPESLRSRARSMAGLLGFDAVEDGAALAANLAQNPQ